MARLKLKSFKWFTLVGAVINICLLAVFSVLFFQAITHYEELAALQGGFTDAQYDIYSAYYVLIYVASISIVFSLLLISMSFRIDQIYYRLRWVNIITSILSIASIIGTSLVESKFSKQFEVVQIFNPIIIYIILFITIILLFIDHIILYIKYKNNPFYHGGTFKKNAYYYHQKQQKKVEDEINNSPQKLEEKKDEKAEIENDLSYFEIYERRSAELKALDEQYENHQISEEEYYKRRKEIYIKYDNKYN